MSSFRKGSCDLEECSNVKFINRQVHFLHHKYLHEFRTTPKQYPTSLEISEVINNYPDKSRTYLMEQLRNAFDNEDTLNPQFYRFQATTYLLENQVQKGLRKLSDSLKSYFFAIKKQKYHICYGFGGMGNKDIIYKEARKSINEGNYYKSTQLADYLRRIIGRNTITSPFQLFRIVMNVVFNQQFNYEKTKSKIEQIIQNLKAENKANHISISSLLGCLEAEKLFLQARYPEAQLSFGKVKTDLQSILPLLQLGSFKMFPLLQYVCISQADCKFMLGTSDDMRQAADTYVKVLKSNNLNVTDDSLMENIIEDENQKLMFSHCYLQLCKLNYSQFMLDQSIRISGPLFCQQNVKLINFIYNKIKTSQNSHQFYKLHLTINKIYQKHFQLYPNVIGPSIVMAKLYSYFQDKKEKALHIIQQVIFQNQGQSELLRWKAIIQSEIGMYSQAEYSLKQIIQKANINDQKGREIKIIGRLQLILLHKKMGNDIWLTKLDQLEHESGEEIKNNRIFIYLKGMQLIQEGKLNQGIAKLYQIGDIDSMHEDAQFQIALGYEKLCQREQAKKFYKKILKKNSHYYKALQKLGRTMRQQKLYKEAEYYFNKIKEFCPSHFTAYNQLALLYLQIYQIQREQGSDSAQRFYCQKFEQQYIGYLRQFIPSHQNQDLQNLLQTYKEVKKNKIIQVHAAFFSNLGRYLCINFFQPDLGQFSQVTSDNYRYITYCFEEGIAINQEKISAILDSSKDGQDKLRALQKLSVIQEKQMEICLNYLCLALVSGKQRLYKDLLQHLNKAFDYSEKLLLKQNKRLSWYQPYLYILRNISMLKQSQDYFESVSTADVHFLRKLRVMIENFRVNFHRSLNYQNCFNSKDKNEFECKQETKQRMFKIMELLIGMGINIEEETTAENQQKIQQIMSSIAQQVKQLYLEDKDYFQIIPIIFLLFFIKKAKIIQSEFSYQVNQGSFDFCQPEENDSQQREPEENELHQQKRKSNNKSITELFKNTYDILDKKIVCLLGHMRKGFKQVTKGPAEKVKNYDIDKQVQKNLILRHQRQIGGYEALLNRFLQVNEGAKRVQKMFKDLFEGYIKNSNGDFIHNRKMGDNLQQEGFKVMVRLTEKILTNKKNTIHDQTQSQIDKKQIQALFQNIKQTAFAKFISNSKNKNLINLFDCLFGTWKNMINKKILQNGQRKYNFLFDDLVRGKATFKTSEDLCNVVNEKNLRTLLSQFAHKQGQIEIDLYSITNRTIPQKQQVHDIVVRVNIDGVVCQLQCSKQEESEDKFSKKTFQFGHKLYEIERSPLGHIFGAFLLFGKAHKAYFSEFLAFHKEQIRQRFCKSDEENEILDEINEFIFECYEEQMKQ